MENNTAKNFVLQLGSLITLYLSVSFLLVLLFSVINLLYPDATEGYYHVESASESVRVGIAMLVVFFPVYLVLTRKVNNFRREETSHSYSGLTKWLIYLSLLIGGGVLLGDFVAIILAFLNGELTTRFVLKAGALLVIVGAAFYYYLQDARGYWLKREKMSLNYAIGMSIIVIASLILGFSHTETPTEVREMKIDDRQVQDLRNIQYRISDYMSANNELPETLDDIFGGVKTVEASEGRKAYTYETTEGGFNLCADFAYPSQNTDRMHFSMAEPMRLGNEMQIKGGNNWDHEEGYVCFERVVSKVERTKKE